MADGLAGTLLGCSESNLEGLLRYSVLVLRKPFGIGFSSPVPGDIGVVPFGGEPNGWNPFIAIFGSSSIRRLDFRKLVPVFAIRS